MYVYQQTLTVTLAKAVPTMRKKIRGCSSRMLDGEKTTQVVDKTKRRTGERKGRKASYRLLCFRVLLR